MGGTWWRSPGWPIPAWVHGNAENLTHAGYRLSEMLRNNVPPIEMRAPGPRTGLGLMVQPIGSGDIGAGITNYGAPYYSAAGGGLDYAPAPSGGGGLPGPLAPSRLSAASSTALVNPVFSDQNGNVITSAVCGSIYSMTFPGYEGKNVYVIQTRNGAQQFAGQMPIPMTNYASVCNQDEGSYQLSGYDPTTGNLIGQGTFTVLPAGTASTAPSSTGTTGATTPTAPATSPAAAVTTPAPAPSVFSNLSTVDWILIAAVVIALVNK